MTIKEIRAFTGLSQVKFADRYSIPVRTLQDWEAGRRTPPAYVVGLLERAVKMDTIILWTTDGHDEWYERFDTEAEAQKEAEKALENHGWKAEVQQLSDYDQQMQETILEQI